MKVQALLADFGNKEAKKITKDPLFILSAGAAELLDTRVRPQLKYYELQLVQTE